MACTNINIAANIVANCNNLGGLGKDVWFGNWDDLVSGGGTFGSTSGVMTAFTMKPGKRIWKLTSGEFQNHFEVTPQMVGGQNLFNQQLTVMGGAAVNNDTTATRKTWNELMKARKLFAIVQLQTTSDTDTHFLFLGYENGLTVAGGDGETSGTNREDLHNLSHQRSGLQNNLPWPFQIDSDGANLDDDLAYIVAKETPAA
jgi:hypothetical protein